MLVLLGGSAPLQPVGPRNPCRRGQPEAHKYVSEHISYVMQFTVDHNVS